jgi:NhaA family Na+:H+ antiporter
MEIKKELVGGYLSSAEARLAPLVAAIAGVVAPILIYLAISHEKTGAFIPAATDIAFTLAILTAFKNKIPPDIRVFVTALAIIDDLIAVIAIALFYSKALVVEYLIALVPVLILLHLLYKKKVVNSNPYLVIFCLVWWLLHKGGIHTTIAGVILGLYLPKSPKLEEFLSNLVNYWILPLFAFYHSQIDLTGVSWDFLTNDITRAIGFGLFFGKQIGIFLAFFVLIRMKVIKTKATFYDCYLAAILCGIGFTMSIFIANLALEGDQLLAAKLGVLLGSLAAAFLGILLLSFKKNLPSQ